MNDKAEIDEVEEEEIVVNEPVDEIEPDDVNQKLELAYEAS